MSGQKENIPPHLREIIEDFQLAEGREKLELLMEYAEKLPQLPNWLELQRNRMEPIPECMTPVYVFAENKGGKLSYYFDIPPQSPTIRGYAQLMREGLEDASPEQVLQVPNDFYLQMGLERVLTSQRLNGISAILAHMKQLAVKEIAEKKV
jgi:cysteine desulfuration protein SufE